MRLKAEYRCLRCAWKWSEVPGRGRPEDVIAPTCPACGHVYLLWANYNAIAEAYNLRQDGMLFEPDNDAEERAEQAPVSDDITVEEMRAELEALGVDVDRMIASVVRKLEG